MNSSIFLIVNPLTYPLPKREIWNWKLKSGKITNQYDIRNQRPENINFDIVFDFSGNAISPHLKGKILI